MGEPVAIEEIENLKGQYDKDNFYWLIDGTTYFDPWGYRFDLYEDEYYYDEYGGYYDDATGIYIPGDQYSKEYYENYEFHELDYGDELDYGEEEYYNEQQEEDYLIEEEENLKTFEQEIKDIEVK